VRVSKLVDASTGHYATTSYEYAQPELPHYLTGITDPRGVEIARTRFYADPSDLVSYKKVEQITAPDGRTTRFYYQKSGLSHPDARWRQRTVDHENIVTIEEFDERGNPVLQMDDQNNRTERAFDS